MNPIFVLIKRLWRRPAAWPPVAPPPAAESADEPQRGCGWFDSSHELQAGLVVLEHASADTAALALGDWLTLQLRDWRGAALDLV